jgi:adenine phosphoribosyltransferase
MTSGGASEAYAALRRAIRDIPDFPRPGILFKDVTPLLADPGLLREAVEAMAEPFAGAGITHVVAIESRGFLFGGPIALALGAGLVPVRKPGKLPYLTRRTEYELEYGTDALEIHGDAFGSPARVLVVDDVIATGGTAGATGRLVELLGGAVAGYSFLIELRFLNGRRQLGAAPAAAVLGY